MIPSLRDYQSELKTNCYKAIQKGERSILNVLATGGGKTIIFADIARDFIKRNKHVWILTHREEIRLQTIEKLVKFELQPGQIASGRPVTNNLLQVASVQTLVNQLEAYKYAGYEPDVIIIDEAHHAVADTWIKILNYWPKCLNLGYTATALRFDGVGLGNVYSYLNEGAQTAELVDKRYLCEPVLFTSKLALEIANTPFKIVNDDYSIKEQTVFMSQTKIVQDTIRCYRKYFNGAPAIIFCVSIEDCHLVSQAMIKAGWKTGVVQSGMDSDVRRNYIRGLANGNYNAICSYEVLGEGVDIPVLAGIIIRRLTASLTNFLQWCGRPLRLAEGKKYGLIVDQAGNYFIHGHPLDHRQWSLEDKKTTLTKSASIQTCSNNECLAVLTGKPAECPYCGENLKEKKSAGKTTSLIVVDAELLQIQKPEFILKPVPPLGEDQEEVKEDQLLNQIIQQTISSDNQKNDLQSRLRILDTALLQNQYTKKAWKKFLLRREYET